MLARCKKTIALITLVTGCFHAVNSMAVGLGELTVNSSLNEPLDATIQVLGLDGLTENQLSISLGSLQDFQRANLSRVGLIDDIDLAVEVFNREEGILRLTSDEPVLEPFLNMVISMRWPNGRLMRDYTALIDLPVFISDEPAAAPVNAPVSPTPRPAEAPRSQILVDNEQPAVPAPRPATPVTTPGTSPANTPDTTPAPSPAPETAQDTGPAAIQAPAETASTPSPAPAAVVESEEEPDQDVVVAAGDNLFNIAAANRPSNNVSVEQTMLAIQRANPDAFIGDNINRIRVGSVLRIPSLQEVQSIDQSQAVNQVALQNQASSAQPLAFNSNTGSGNQQGEDELTILSGNEGTSPSGDSDMAATIAALENQLAVSEENLDRARLENQELRSRFAQLEEQIEILQNIIAMQDQRLAQLQADLAANAAAPEPVTETPAQPQPITAQPAPQDNSLMGQLSSMFENTLVLISSLVALIVLVLGFLVWRRRAAQDEMDDYAMGDVAIAGSSRAAYIHDEPAGASAGFLAALKTRFRNEDEDDGHVRASDIAVDDDSLDDSSLTDIDSSAADDEDEDDEEEGGMMSRLKGLFSRSSDDDDDFDDLADDDEDDDDEGYSEETDEDDDTDDMDEEISAFAMDDEDDEDDEADSDDEVAEAEEEFDFDFDEDDDTDEIADTKSEDDDDSDEDENEVIVALAEDGVDEDDLDLGNLGDLELDEDTVEISDDADEADSEEDAPETFDFSLDDDAEDKADDLDDDSPDEEEVESFDFSVSDKPAVEDTAEPEPADDVETFAFDVGSVSSFEEDDNEDDSAEEEAVETFDFDLGDKTETNTNTDDVSDDPLAAALNEIDVEVETGNPEDSDNSDDLDLGDIEIDESLFDADDDEVEAIGERDEASTKLDLAVAYEAMGDMDGAREILNEVIAEGNDDQAREAKDLLEKWKLS